VRVIKERLANGETQYLARPIVDGKKLAVRAATKSEVERRVATLKEKQHRRRLGLDEAEERRPDITFGALADLFVEQYQHSSRSKRTLEERLEYARRAFGPLNVRTLRPEAIGVWNARLELSPTTRGHALKALKRVCAAGVEWGYLATNPVKVKSPNPAKRRVRPFESWDDVYKVAAKAGVYGPLIRFACATGLRPQEWQALEWQDIDFTARELHVRRTLQDGQIRAAGKTDGSLRTVQLQAVALEALNKLTRPLAGGLIFRAPEGGVINLSNYRRRVWKEALEAAEIEYRAIDETRHTFATLAITAGAPIEWVSRQLGHSNIQTTLKHYARWLPAANQMYIAVLDAFAEQTGLKADSAAEASAND
jgi:integrase